MRKTTILTIILGLFILGIFAGCDDKGREANIGPEEKPDRTDTVAINNNRAMNTNTAVNDNVTVADIMGNTNAYIDKTVVVSAWAEKAYGANAFRLDEDSVFTGGIDNDLLVVGANGVIPAGLKYGDADAKVRITGTVKRMVIADIEREYDFDLTTDVEVYFKDKPVLVAKTVQVVERD